MNIWKSVGHIFWNTITGSSHSTAAVFDVVSTQAPICLNVKWRIYLLKNRIQVPGVDYSSGSEGYDYGYDFAVQADPSVKMRVEMDIISQAPMCVLTNVVSVVPESSAIHYTQLCREESPKGQVRVAMSELLLLVENIWQATWAP